MIEDKIFKGLHYSEHNLAKEEYDNCTFSTCNFSDSDLSNITFRDCEFIDCDLSNVKLKHTVLSDIEFVNCKLLGLHFNDCNELFMSLGFKNCRLELSTFYQLKLKQTLFKDCKLISVDFTETDLTRSIFQNCDLKQTIFDRTILEHVNFESAFNFSIDPELNRIKNAKFSKENISGLLDKYKIKIKP